MKNVLLVEDSDDDIFFIKMACQRSGIPHSLHVVKDGEAAIGYLSRNDGHATHATRPFPDLVFLDIRIPKRNGHEVLEWIRSRPGLKNLPVVMVTSSTENSDVNRAYELGVTSYLRKVASRAEFGQAVRVILKYWLEINTAPTE